MSIFKSQREQVEQAEDLKRLLAEAAAESYHREFLEAAGEEEGERLVRRMVNRDLDSLGLNHILSLNDLRDPNLLAGVIAEAPAAEIALRELPRHLRAWAAKEPPRGAERRAEWAEAGRGLLLQCRLESQDQ